MVCGKNRCLLQGVFPVSPETPVFPFPPLEVVQVPLGTVFEMSLAPEELTLDNVRNLNAVLTGVNEAPELFDRISLVNATVVYTVPEPVPALSTWMMVLMGALFLGAGIIFKRRFLKS